MADWTKSMEQTFEYYIVDPGTWKDVRPLTQVKSSSITRELSSETLGSASFDITELLGECYIRIYLVVRQNGLTEKFPLGTYLIQTPSSNFNGRIHNFQLDASPYNRSIFQKSRGTYLVYLQVHNNSLYHIL